MTKYNLYLLLLVVLPLRSIAQTSIVATQVITVAASQPSSSPQYTSDTKFQSAILNSTNFFRKEHNATAVTWNSTLADFASNYTNGCQWQHSGGPYGENLAEGFADVTSAVDGWGDEQAQYDYNNPGFSEGTGHFTQLVWKSTTSVGCGRTYCNGKNGALGWFLACEYYPRGNFLGEFGTEVDPATVTNGTGVCNQGAGCMSVGSMTSVGKLWVILVLLQLVLWY